MEQGLKNLQQAHRSAQRKNRIDHKQDSGIGVSDTEHDEGHSLQRGGPDIQSMLSTTPTVSSRLCPKDQSAPGKSSPSVPDVLSAQSLSLFPEYPMGNISKSSAKDLTLAKSRPFPPDSSKPRKATLAIDLSEPPSQSKGGPVPSPLENLPGASPGRINHHERRQSSAPVIVLPELASSPPRIFSDSYPMRGRGSVGNVARARTPKFQTNVSITLYVRYRFVYIGLASRNTLIESRDRRLQYISIWSFITII